MYKIVHLIVCSSRPHDTVYYFFTLYLESWTNLNFQAYVNVKQQSKGFFYYVVYLYSIHTHYTPEDYRYKRDCAALIKKFEYF